MAFGVVLLDFEYSLLGAMTGFINRTYVSDYDALLSKILASLPSTFLTCHSQSNDSQRKLLASSKEYLISVKYWDLMNVYSINLAVIPNRDMIQSQANLDNVAFGIFNKLACEYPINTHNLDKQYVFLDFRDQ